MPSRNVQATPAAFAPAEGITAAVKPALRLVREKIVTMISAAAMTSGIVFEGTTSNSHAPRSEPAVIAISNHNRLLGSLSTLRNGKLPPSLKKISANILVATATCGSKPKESITGTVSNEVPPVTTLMTAVKKNAAIKQSKPKVLMHPRVPNLPARFQFAATYNGLYNAGGSGVCEARWRGFRQTGGDNIPVLKENGLTIRFSPLRKSLSPREKRE
jgi:hypothetical protein